jgi:Fic family protein
MATPATTDNISWFESQAISKALSFYESQKRQPEEFTRSEFQRKYGYTRWKAESALEELVKQGVIVRRRSLQNTWLYRETVCKKRTQKAVV